MDNTIGQRQAVTAWWIFHRMDTMPAGKITPEVLEDLIDEAETDLSGCDKTLAEQYAEYIPQL